MFRQYIRESSATLQYVVPILAALVIISSSCRIPQKATYFSSIQQDTAVKYFVSDKIESKIRKGDNLAISINSLSLEENARFNSTVLKGTGETDKVAVPGYLVSNEGTIKIYRLGEIKVEGLTRTELATKLQNDLKPYLKEPLVNVAYLNRKVTVLGGVATPKVLNLDEEQITLFDALARCGDISEKGNADQVFIIREVNDEKQFKKINLKDLSVFESNWYYLQSDDIVYVTPDYSKLEREEKRRNLQITLSLIASGASLIFLLLNRFL
jgi:polysaccharide export outer membrane protein